MAEAPLGKVPQFGQLRNYEFDRGPARDFGDGDRYILIYVRVYYSCAHYHSLN